MYRILVVDDEPIIRKGLIKLIEQSNYSFTSIRSAENGERAMEMIKEEQPDFLFSDIQMPKCNGLTLCEQVSNRYPNIQMVVISGYSDFLYAQKSLSYGVKDYMLKPVNKKKVQDVLDKLTANLNSKPPQVHLSIAKLDELNKLMEDAIWSLDTEKLDECFNKLKQEIQIYNFQGAQQKELLDEYYGILIMKLNARDVFPFINDLNFQEILDSETIFNEFKSKVTQIMSELRIKRKGKQKDAVVEAKHYIEKHLSKDVSLEEVADFLGLNASYFSQLFKQKTNETFVQYRIKRRMEKAKKLLEIPHYRITDISYEIGYSDHPHFTKTFKKYAGCSPSDYRRQMGID